MRFFLWTLFLKKDNPLPKNIDKYIKQGAKYLVLPIQLVIKVKYRTERITIKTWFLFLFLISCNNPKKHNM